MKAIVKCYWKSCLVLGIFTFLEVKIFYILCVAFKCVQISTEMDAMVGREDSSLSQDKSHHDVPQWLCLFLECTELKGVSLQGISTKLAKSSFRFSHNCLWERMALTRQDVLYHIRTFLVLST